MRLDNGDQQAWRRYKQLVDDPDWFTRWMLERTQAVLMHYEKLAAQSIRHPELTAADAALGKSALNAITNALQQAPAVPPAPVDARVDMLQVVLSDAQALFVAELFLRPANKTEDSRAAVLADVKLDAVQQKRKNPWGGFREAWLEHYNHLQRPERY